MTVFVFGLDGASLQNLGEVMKRIQLPHFQKVLAEGKSFDMHSIYPYVTAPAWTSIFSGVNPGKHGIFDMLQLEGASLRPSNLRNSDVPFLWDYLSWAGKKMLIMGVPFIHPAPEINGVFVTGRFSPELSCYPRDLANDIDLSGYDYSNPNLSAGKRWKFVKQFGLRKLADLELDMLNRRAQASIKLVDSAKWDTVLLTDSQPDELFHLAYKNKEIVAMLFKGLDDWLSHLITRVTERDELLILSDHGFGEVRSKFFINEWLRLEGYMIVKKQTRSRMMRTLDQKTLVLSRSAVGQRGRRYVLKKMNNVLGLTPISMNRVQYENYHMQLGSKVIPFTVHEQVAWLKILPKNAKDREKVALSLVRDLEELKRKGLVKNVFMTTSLYHGNYMSKIPGEVLVEFEDGFSLAEEINNSGILQERANSQRHGTHRYNGILVFYGNLSPNINSAPGLYDVVPTILSMMKLPLPNYFDGKTMIDSGSSTIVVGD